MVFSVFQADPYYLVENMFLNITVIPPESRAYLLFTTTDLEKGHFFLQQQKLLPLKTAVARSNRQRATATIQTFTYMLRLSMPLLLLYRELYRWSESLR